MNEKAKISVLKAFAHPVRLQILRHLVKGACCAKLANKAIPISQPNMSQNLKLLKSAGIVDFKKIGTKHCYYLCKPSLVKQLIELIDLEHEVVQKSDQEIQADFKKRFNEMNQNK